MKRIFPLFAVIIVLVIRPICSFHIIPTGYTGVKTSFRPRSEETTLIQRACKSQLLHSLCAEHPQGQQQAAG